MQSKTEHNLGCIEYATFAKSAIGSKSKKIINNSEHRSLEERSNDLNDRESGRSVHSQPRVPKKV